MIKDYSSDFALMPDHIWLNAASEGPIPKVAAQALMEAITWKSAPHLLTIPKFIEAPILLKQSLAKLINVLPQDIILGNSATYGVHLLSNGLDLKVGDEVLLMRNDFPSDILPWLHLKEKGVSVIQLKAKGLVLTPDEIKAAITPKTCVVCLPMVHSFSGAMLDITSIGALCRERNIIFVVNMSQVLGAIPIDLSALPVDAIVCAGYKWLLGPYGTGFCWTTSGLRKQLKYPQAYWISLMDEKTLQGEEELSLPTVDSARKYDVFGTANFFNFVPWRASIEYLLGVTIDAVLEHRRELYDKIMCGLNQEAYTLLSPICESPILVLTHKKAENNSKVYEYLKANGLHVALWKNKLRIAAHLYNTEADINCLIKHLNLKG